MLRRERESAVGFYRVFHCNIPLECVENSGFACVAIKMLYEVVMKKWWRYALFVLFVLVVGVCSLLWWLTPKQVEQMANYFLLPEYRLQLSDQWLMQSSELQLSELQLATSECTLARLQNVRLNWWPPRLEVENAVVDYACFDHLPVSEDTKTPPKLTALFDIIPDSELVIEHLRIKGLDEIQQPMLHQLISSDMSVTVHYDGEQLKLHANTRTNAGLLLQHHSTLVRQHSSFQWHGQTDFQPSTTENYHLNFTLQLNDELWQPPSQGDIILDWQNSQWTVEKGHLQFVWNGDEGKITAQDLTRNAPLLDIPFTFTEKGLDISWGTFYWTFDGYQPIKGFLGLAARKPQEGWLPLGLDLNVILQTFGEQGKGEIVISGKNGEIGGGEKKNALFFDLTTRGDLRYNNTVAQTNLKYHIGGDFDLPLLHFSPGSIFKMDNLQPDSKIHVRVPLDDVLIGRYGLEGRLQATLQGFTPQFEQLDLKLDGLAHEFIAGIKTIFELRDERQKLRVAELQAANRWDWTIEGDALWKSLKMPVNIKGIGFWEGDHIELNQLFAHSGKVSIDGVKMAPLSLELKDRLRWNYEKQHIRGLMQAKTDWIEFAYGGRFEKPVFGLGIDGKSIDHFNAAGDLKAGSLGPLDLLATYENNVLSGKISWKEQSAKVFQSLFPQQWEWIIHQGSIKGESDFVINGGGIAMTGILNLHHGKITMPDGEIEGLNISFPLNYQNLKLQLKSNHPINFSVKNMRIGALTTHNGTFDIFGTYPYSEHHPLTLSKVKIGLFDGELTVDKLNFPQRQMALLSFKNIDLAQVLEMAQYNQLSLNGRANATFPFWLGHKTCLICNGTLEQVGKLHLKVNESVVDGLKKGGWTEGILVDLLKELELNGSQASIDLAPNGQMTLRATINGFNPTKQSHHPITLNYMHRENMFELWDMIDYGSQFEQKLQHRLYRQLEK